MGVTEIVREARKLPLDDLRALTAELDEELAQRIDSRFEESVKSGAFDHLAEEALQEYRSGKTKPLNEIIDDKLLS